MPGIFAALAVMLSPRGLTVAGNGAGIAGVAFIGFLLLAGVLSFRTAQSIATIPATNGKLKHWYFPFVLGLLDAARLMALTVFSVSWLGLAGYALNEVFLHWYPNLAASFTLLAVALGSCFIPNDKGKFLFGAAILIALGAFLYLSSMATQPADTGLWYPSVVPLMVPVLVPIDFMSNGAMPWLQALFLSLLAFIGFDLSLNPGQNSTRTLPALLIIFVVFSLFLWGALLVAAPEKLSSSFVPHFRVARAVLGDTGRVLIALTVVLGSLAAVMAVMRNLGYRLAALCNRASHPRWKQAVAVVLSIVMATLLATGWAGEDALEAFIGAGICFWFAAYALFDLGNIIAFRKVGKTPPLSILAFLLHCFAAGMAIYTTEYPVHMLASVGGIAFVGFILMFLHKRMEYITPEAADSSAYEDIPSSEYDTMVQSNSLSTKAEQLTETASSLSTAHSDENLRDSGNTKPADYFATSSDTGSVQTSELPQGNADKNVSSVSDLPSGNSIKVEASQEQPEKRSRRFSLRKK